MNLYNLDDNCIAKILGTIYETTDKTFLENKFDNINKNLKDLNIYFDTIHLEVLKKNTNKHEIYIPIEESYRKDDIFKYLILKYKGLSNLQETLNTVRVYAVYHQQCSTLHSSLNLSPITGRTFEIFHELKLNQIYEKPLDKLFEYAINISPKIHEDIHYHGIFGMLLTEANLIESMTNQMVFNDGIDKLSNNMQGLKELYNRANTSFDKFKYIDLYQQAFHTKIFYQFAETVMKINKIKINKRLSKQ